ncbi:MAG: hypothetical protein IPG85_04415 [Bacteroidetes bacterium]|nr:hypothetical protein [Bacteroidota bacterium]
MNWHTDNMAKDEWTVIENCTFRYNNKGQARPNSNSYMRGVRFKGRNKIENILNGVNSYHMMSTRDAMLEGSDTACVPNELLFEGQVEHNMVSSSIPINDTFTIGYKLNGNEGYGQYKIQEKALLVTEGQTALYIGSKSTLEVTDGGSLYGIQGSGNFLISGGLIAHKNSYICLENGTFNNLNANADTLLYVDKDANKNQTTISPLWANGIGYGSGTQQPTYNGNWLNGYIAANAPCIQGGHASLTFGACGAPLYTNVISKNSLHLLYNKKTSCFGIGATDSFSFNVLGGTPTYTITCATINNGASLSTNTVYGVNAGIYTLQVSDANCTETFIVNLDTTFEYKMINGCVGMSAGRFKTNACGTVTMLSSPPLANIVQLNDTVTVGLPGNYTFVATSPTGSDTTTIYIGDCNNCSTAPDSAEWFAPNTSSNSISPTGVLDSRPIVLQGNVSVNNEWYIYNNPHVYLTQYTELKVTTNNALIINMSHLQGCTEYWKGIEASGNGERVVVNNNSTIQDMERGIAIKNNAFIQARHSSFLNNIVSISVTENMYPSFENMIWGNTFKGDTNMFANAYGNKPNVGIYISGVGNYNIGVLDDSTTVNTFEHLTTGIRIFNNVNNVTDSKIGIYNCKFDDIGYSDYDYNKLKDCYSTARGAAIYCQTGPSPATERSIDVRNHSSFTTTNMFKNCDKMIVSIGGSVNAQVLKSDSCMFGIMCSNTEGRHVYAEYNTLSNIRTGIQSNGNCASSRIIGNQITALGSAIVNPLWIGKQWPCGISINKILNTGSDSFIVKNNHVEINSYGGVGISIYNTNTNTEVRENTVEIYPSIYMLSPDSSQHNGLYGISAVNVEKSKIYKNNIIGNDDINESARENVYGLLLNHSYNYKAECNTMQKTRFGLGAISNCFTDSLG